MVAHTGSTRPARSPRRLNELRRLNQPRPVLVEAHGDGIPHHVNRLGVAIVREEWRIVDRWWTDEPVDRRYFDLVLETGRVAVVFHDGESGRWFAQNA